jgi:undecaprenyl-diphosphatase
MAVAAVFWREILAILKNPFQKYVLLIIAATIPAAAAAFLFGDVIDGLFMWQSVTRTAYMLAACFVITGVALMLSDRPSDGRGRDVTFGDALIVGLAQAVAITPAISRSGATICAALSRKITREDAAKFSFMMSIPAILGAALLEAVKILRDPLALAGARAGSLAAGFVAAALSGFLAVNFMMALIKRCRLRYFSFYVFGVAAFILIDRLLLGGAVLGNA